MLIRCEERILAGLRFPPPPMERAHLLKLVLDRGTQIRKDVGHVVGEKGAQCTDEAHALRASAVEPVEAVHSVYKLKHLATVKISSVYQNQASFKKKEHKSHRDDYLQMITCFDAAWRDKTVSGARSISRMCFSEETNT